MATFTIEELIESVEERLKKLESFMTVTPQNEREFDELCEELAHLKLRLAARNQNDIEG